ncbi:MSHA biogenesis protein MshN [Vibrio sp. ABG19]|nr:MSHA biogenesis protein MshN [Vibrio sp. ABG19]WGY48570.1 tetratricopeptide repeat protein [Vibrio sp. ABG19]
MSEINKALSQLAAKRGASLEQIEAARVAPVKTRPGWVWALGGCALSLALGGWAVSWQAPHSLPADEGQGEPVLLAAQQTELAPTASPTRNTSPTAIEVYRPSRTVSDAPREKNVAQAAAQSQPPPPSVTAPRSAPPQQPAAQESDRQSATDTSAQSVESDNRDAHMMVEQVELTPQQLAQKALSRADKALDSNDFQDAVDAYSEALRYTPEDETVRQKLAALYYGKGDVRRAFDLLQNGIELNRQGERLRIALAKLLIKEQQPEAALSPLAFLPAAPSLEYLSLRAALAQKSKHNELALESYQALTQKEPGNGRWWLGLAIQQERAFTLPEARASYQQALSKVGLSSQSQTFIRDRLAVIAAVEEDKRAN